MKLASKEVEAIFQMSAIFSGASVEASVRKDLVVHNVLQRMQKIGCSEVASYLQKVKTDRAEREAFVSLTTIHTTAWFREVPHFEAVQAFVRMHAHELRMRELKVWSAACSTGEEPYSLGLLLHQLQLEKKIQFQITATDVDRVSLGRCERAVYDLADVGQIPLQFRNGINVGKGPASSLFAIDKSVRTFCRFQEMNLSSLEWPFEDASFDIVFCRHVLLYFDRAQAELILARLIQKVRPGGLLILGHSEAGYKTLRTLETKGRSVYQIPTLAKLSLRKKVLFPDGEPSETAAQVLIVEDSPLIQKSLRKLFSQGAFEVTECSSAEEATQLCQQKKFDLITLDLNLPNENGVAWLERSRRNGLKCPVIVVSDSSPSEVEKVFGAILSGAQDYVMKSRLHSEPSKVLALFEAVVGKKKADQNIVREILPFDSSKFKPKVILVGASTGGTEAIGKLLKEFPRPCPPVMVVQHMGVEFYQAFAKRIAKESGLNLGSDENNTTVLPNHIYFAMGDYHLGLIQKEGLLMIKRQYQEPKFGHRPCVDVLFQTAHDSQIAGVAVVLTGMGTDGAEAMMRLQSSGRFYCLAQNEKSSVVYGMPKKAIELGAAHFTGDVQSLRDRITRLLSGEKSEKV